MDSHCQAITAIIVGHRYLKEHVLCMSKLKAAARKKIPSSKFGLPGARKYPMPDKSHAANAKARATQMVNRGKLSGSEAAEIRVKANQVLHAS